MVTIQIILIYMKKEIFYLTNKNESILYTRKNLINNINYFILIKHLKNI